MTKDDPSTMNTSKENTSSLHFQKNEWLEKENECDTKYVNVNVASKMSDNRPGWKVNKLNLWHLSKYSTHNKCHIRLQLCSSVVLWS